MQSLLYPALVIFLSVLVSWYIGKLATWGMCDPQQKGGFRYALDALFVKRMSGIHLAIPVFSKGYRPKQGKVAP